MLGFIVKVCSYDIIFSQRLVTQRFKVLITAIEAALRKIGAKGY
ncbi:hypothetical protein N474_14925 [Pseudoalteromonas luteoviolacea CPMOR-2]|uniref:Uncharacterized protein n=1 Tax=Pseudoalteromonas luteoviolacea DSM 6061 TaxID=1365250 RepID=A0A166W9L8_9GAMM|nr:hypothetical protein N475_17865 [Pseudoalteromonas luteoviolacea DSM 6061]KZN55609.1 hypothetical protein N474_14925 [Pseudoalteromonas luteoviolacea CPMOR-2]MBE0386705.1 hypothetical protein [Pseudoalteromonas luteoviolacea DSM 6061]